VADLYDFKSPFESFVEKYKTGSVAKGKVKSIGQNAKGVFGVFVTIENVDCLIPYSMLPNHLKANNAECLVISSEIEVSIHSIDIATKRITVKIPEQRKNQHLQKTQDWENEIKKIKKGDFVKGIVQKEVNFGYFIKLDSGLEGLLHRNNIRKNKTLNLNETVQVKIIRIDTAKKQIAFSY